MSVEELIGDEGEPHREMGLLKLLRESAGRDSSTLHECRDCGKKLPSDADACPDCGSTETARYTFPPP